MRVVSIKNIAWQQRTVKDFPESFSKNLSEIARKSEFF